MPGLGWRQPWRLGDRFWLEWCPLPVGWLLLLRGELEEAEEYLHAGLSMVKQTRNLWVETYILTWLAVLWRKRGQVQEARRYAAQGLMTAQSGTPTGTGGSGPGQPGLGRLARGGCDEAQTLAQAALDSWQRNPSLPTPSTGRPGGRCWPWPWTRTGSRRHWTTRGRCWIPCSRGCPSPWNLLWKEPSGGRGWPAGSSACYATASSRIGPGVRLPVMLVAGTVAPQKRAEACPEESKGAHYKRILLLCPIAVVKEETVFR